MKTSLTIAIPTRNRLGLLDITLKHMLSLSQPENLSVSFSISATACSDGTADYLLDLSRKNERVYAYTKSSSRTRWNWIYLIRAIPKNSEWIWLFGDDDIIVDSEGFQSIANLIELAKDEGCSIICIPQAKRTPFKDRIEIDKLICLCEKYGVHEVLGWMTSLIMKREVFIQFIDLMRIRFSRVYTDAGLNRLHVSPFFHSLAILKLNTNVKTIFALSKIVDEMDYPLTIKRNRNMARSEEFLHERFLFTFTEFNDFLLSQPAAKNFYFYRYVNKTFFDLYLNILADDLINNSNPNELHNKLNELKSISKLIDDFKGRPIREYMAVLERLINSRRKLTSVELKEVILIYDETKRPYLNFTIGENN